MDGERQVGVEQRDTERWVGGLRATEGKDKIGRNWHERKERAGEAEIRKRQKGGREEEGLDAIWGGKEVIFYLWFFLLIDHSWASDNPLKYFRICFQVRGNIQIRLSFLRDYFLID